MSISSHSLTLEIAKLDAGESFIEGFPKNQHSFAIVYSALLDVYQTRFFVLKNVSVKRQNEKRVYCCQNSNAIFIPKWSISLEKNLSMVYCRKWPQYHIRKIGENLFF